MGFAGVSWGFVRTLTYPLTPKVYGSNIFFIVLKVLLELPCCLMSAEADPVK